MNKVQQKVNRHVLKALSVLYYYEEFLLKPGFDFKLIKMQVEHQMSSAAPLANLQCLMQNSLDMFVKLGLVDIFGNRRYALVRRFNSGDYEPGPYITSPQDETINRNTMRSKLKNEESDNRDVCAKRLPNSDESLSGDEFARTRKRLHTNNKQIKHDGRNTILPRARQHSENNILDNNKQLGNLLKENHDLKTQAVYVSHPKLMSTVADHLPLLDFSQNLPLKETIQNFADCAVQLKRNTKAANILADDNDSIMAILFINNKSPKQDTSSSNTNLTNPRVKKNSSMKNKTPINRKNDTTKADPLDIHSIIKAEPIDVQTEVDNNHSHQSDVVPSQALNTLSNEDNTRLSDCFDIIGALRAENKALKSYIDEKTEASAENTCQLETVPANSSTFREWPLMNCAENLVEMPLEDGIPAKRFKPN